MPKIHTDRSCAAARRGVRRGLVGCVIAATLAAAAGTAQAAVPKVGAWESGSRSEPRVSFDVQGPAGARAVRRVSFPITCRNEVVGWGATTVVSTRANGRFTAYLGDSVIGGRFTGKGRAAVTVRGSDPGCKRARRYLVVHRGRRIAVRTGCKRARRYLVVHRGRRIAVRTGRYVSLVSGGATVGLETDAFGRMVDVEYIQGSIPSRCSDGSQRPLTLVGPKESVLAAPIRPSGRFDISAAAGGSGISIGGTFAAASVAAVVDLSAVLPDGTRCKALTQSLVGSLAFPLATPRESETFAGPPAIIPNPG